MVNYERKIQETDVTQKCEVLIYIFQQILNCFFQQDDVDPEQFWEIIGELGDGAFGKVRCILSGDIFNSILNFEPKLHPFVLWMFAGQEVWSVSWQIVELV